ncbi:hypothetical protein KY285_008651 [Solanum tuberosum]|nr:hypothetical protein KY285_008651 [Solanum tuberosum]
MLAATVRVERDANKKTRNRRVPLYGIPGVKSPSVCRLELDVVAFHAWNVLGSFALAVEKKKEYGGVGFKEWWAGSVELGIGLTDLMKGN